MENKEYIPAYLNEKDVTTDWIDMVFDNFSCVCGGRKNNIYVGFVNDIVTTARVHDNVVEWNMQNGSDDDYISLKNKLLAFEEESDLFSFVEWKDYMLFQSFYFKN